jgi:ABC-type uncharacterized transport system permease subunit
MSGAAYRLAIALLPVLYFALAASNTSRSPLRRFVAWSTVVLHAALFALIRTETGAFPLVIPGAALSALALATFVVYSWVESRSKVLSLGGLVLSGILIMQLGATVIGFSPAAPPPTASKLFIIHVITIIASVATLLLSGFFGIIYLIVEREMRSQHFGPLFARLPKLSELSGMNRLAATAGFLLMTVGFNLGIWLAHDTAREGFSYRDPMVVITMAAWVVFGLIGLSRWVNFLSGRKAAVTAVAGILLLLLTIVISLVPGLSFHRLS